MNFHVLNHYCGLFFRCVSLYFCQFLRLVVISCFKDHVADKLDTTIFPYVKDGPSKAPTPMSLRSPPPQTTSLRSQKPSWHRAAKPGTSVVNNRERLLVFIAGGMTYSEIREAYQLSTSLNKDIFIGNAIESTMAKRL